jgi:serine O-acetyltransferase
MNNTLNVFREDFHAALTRDPAARTKLEVLLNDAGLHAIWAHRISHWLWVHNLKLIARTLSQITRGITGVEIHPGAVIGEGFFIDHGMGVVIGETSEIGNNVTMYHGVTLGGVSLEKGKRHPTIGDGVVIGAGAIVLGAIEVGKESRVGANAVVVKSVPPHSIVVGVPGHVIRRRGVVMDTPDLHHELLPDTVALTINAIIRRLDSLESEMGEHQLEHRQNGNGHHNDNGHEAEEVTQKALENDWSEDDFVI